MAASLTATASLSAELTVSYPQALLTVAKRLIDGDDFGKYGIATVVAHMACEVAVERALSAAFSGRELHHLHRPVIELLNGYNLANERIRKLFAAVTDLPVHEQPFWQAFKASAERRGKVVHGVHVVTEDEALSSLRAATALIDFLKQ